MTATPRVAVIIPCFNAGELLREAVRSVAEQEPCELVVVDDGSTEAVTLAVLGALEDEGVTVLRQANAGPSAARMTGLAATSAPYVHPLDADDRFPPGALTALADALDRRPDAAVAWGAYRTFGATDCHFPSAPELDPWRITYFDEIPGTSMMRRDRLVAVGGWSGTGGYEDWDLWMSFAEAGESGVRVPQVTLLYREREEAGRYRDDLARHDEHWALLERRHARLFAARRANRPRSSTPRALQALVVLVDALPLPAGRKGQLWAIARFYTQREMCSSCYPSPFTRLRRHLRAGRGRPAV